MKKILILVLFIVSNILAAQQLGDKGNIALCALHGRNFQQLISKGFSNGKESNTLLTSVVLLLKGRNEIVVANDFLGGLEAQMKESGWQCNSTEYPQDRILNPLHIALIGTNGNKRMIITVIFFPSIEGKIDTVCTQTEYKDFGRSRIRR